MEIHGILILLPLLFLAVLALGYLYWRFVWFFRNPERSVADGDNITSAADGTVVYVERLQPKEPVISIKQGKRLCLSDIVRRDLEDTKLLIGVFMSPFDVHVNRAPIAGTVRSVEHHPAAYRNHHMGAMHLRSLLKRIPIYLGSRHIETNERTVTSIEGTFKGDPVSCHVVQIAGGSVRGIHSYVLEGERLAKGDIFGEIRVGSQVDLVVTWRDSMRPRVKPGDKVKAGLTVMVD